MSDKLKNASKVKQRYEKEWLGLKGVVAVGIGHVDNKPGIIISVEKEADMERLAFPSVVEGIPTKIQVTGKIKAQ